MIMKRNNPLSGGLLVLESIRLPIIQYSELLQNGPSVLLLELGLPTHQHVPDETLVEPVDQTLSFDGSTALVGSLVLRLQHGLQMLSSGDEVGQIDHQVDSVLRVILDHLPLLDVLQRRCVDFYKVVEAQVGENLDQIHILEAVVWVDVVPNSPREEHRGRRDVEG